MTKPKQTRELIYERATPCCPNCDGSMIDATVTIGELSLAWPLPEPEMLRADGYADHAMAEAAGAPIATCPDCRQESLLSIGRGGMEIALTLLRTNADRRYLGEEVAPRRRPTVGEQIETFLLPLPLPVVDVLVFTYRNHRGEVAERRVDRESVRFHFGKTEWHPEPQDLMSAWDLDKRANRDFAARDILHFGPLSAAPSPAAPAPAGEAVREANDAEAFIQAAIDRAPEPLRHLGEWLANKLDEDDWKTAERLLLGAATTPAPDADGLREAVAAFFAAFDREPEKDCWDTESGEPEEGAERFASDWSWADYHDRVQKARDHLRAALAQPAESAPSGEAVADA